MNTPSTVFNISLHCIILFTFLSIFYWGYIIYQESAGIEELLRLNVINRLDRELQDSKIKISDQLTNLLKSDGKIPPAVGYAIDKTNVDIYKPIIKNTLKKIVSSENRVQDQLFNNNHSIYMLLNFIIFMIILIISMCIVFYLYTNNYDIDYKTIILENIAIIILVGTVELIFFKLIASKYEPLDDKDINEFTIDIIKEL